MKWSDNLLVAGSVALMAVGLVLMFAPNRNKEDSMKARAAETTEVPKEEAEGTIEIKGQMYQASCWTNSKGEFGATAKIWIEPKEGESIGEAIKRGNIMAVKAQREIIELLGEEHN